MSIQKIAAFSDGNTGGNPAGVLIYDKHPEPKEMQAIAAEVGYSETAFAEPIDGGYKVRYFSPESEVPFGLRTKKIAGKTAKPKRKAVSIIGLV